MGGCCQKQVRQVVQSSKHSVVMPSRVSPPVCVQVNKDADEVKVKLVGDITCPYTQRVRIALLEKSVPAETSLVMPEDLMGGKGDNLAAESPDGKFPVFQHGPHKITGSVDSILTYIEENFENPLLPSGLEKDVAQWVSYIRDIFSNVIEDALHNGDPYAQDSLEARLNESLACLDDGLELHHKEGKHFLGSNFTLVDVYLIPFLSLMDLVTYIRGFEINSSFTRLSAYKSAMCTFKCYKPVQMGTDLTKTILVQSSIDKPSQPMVGLALLQHKSIIWHLKAFVKLVKEFDGINRSPSMDSMQRTVFVTRLKKLPKVYGRLVELLLEHAQMEERVIFPALETADQALTESALKDHARDLPVMNGIREDIKGIMSLRQGNFDHREALTALAGRVEAFEVHVKEHFKEEEKEQLPLLEAAGFGTSKQQPMVAQAFLVMEASHSRLLPYLLEGLKPHEVHQYLGIMKLSTADNAEKNSMLRRIAHVLNNEEFEYVRKVAIDRIPSLGGLPLTSVQGRPGMARG